jgi:hypothetical protein
MSDLHYTSKYVQYVSLFEDSFGLADPSPSDRPANENRALTVVNRSLCQKRLRLNFY